MPGTGPHAPISSFGISFEVFCVSAWLGIPSSPWNLCQCMAWDPILPLALVSVYDMGSHPPLGFCGSAWLGIPSSSWYSYQCMAWDPILILVLVSVHAMGSHPPLGACVSAWFGSLLLALFTCSFSSLIDAFVGHLLGCSKGLPVYGICKSNTTRSALYHFIRSNTLIEQHPSYALKYFI